MNREKHIVLGVTGSIAAYKAADIASALAKEGFLIDVVLTEGAQKFIRPLTFAALTHRPVMSDLWDEDDAGRPGHIELADRADLVLIAPATAHQLALMRAGLAPDALNSVLLATRAPVFVAPAMNGKMWEHPATRDNARVLEERGVRFIGPDSGLLACGYEGIGRMWPSAQVAQAVVDFLR